MTRPPRQPASFGRVVLTPFLLLFAAVLVGMLNPDWLVPALIVAAVVGAVYVFTASRR